MTATTANAPRSVMYVYPWDLYEHGVDDALAELQSCAMQAVQLAFSYHVASYLRPRAPERRAHFGGLGALQFDPAVLPAHAWPFPPPVAPQVSGPRYLTELLERIHDHGLTTIAWVVYLYNHQLASERPELAVRNAFGDAHAAQLCPAHPQVRAYALALTEAVAQHTPLHGFVAESLTCLPFDYGLLNLKASVRPRAHERFLLSVCFCEHCRHEAESRGVPTGELQLLVRNAIDDGLARLPDEADAGEQQVDGPLAAYLRSRSEVASDLHRQVLKRANAAGLRVGTTAAESSDERLSGVPHDAVDELWQELRIELHPSLSDERIGALVHAARTRAGPDRPVYGLAQLSRFASEPEFRRVYRAAQRHGLRHARLYQFGLLNHRQLDWLRRARPYWSDQAATGTDPHGTAREGKG